MVVDQFGAAVPFGAGIAERADEFLFLGVDADDRCVLDGAALAQFGDVLELVVAVRMGRIPDFPEQCVGKDGL